MFDHICSRGVVNGEQEKGAQGASADAAPWLGPLVAVIAAACGASPFVHGFYAFSVWGVIALGMLALVWGLALGGYMVLSRLALVALAGLAVLALVSLLSVGWAEAADRARVEAARWILYATTFGVFLAVL